MAQKVNRILGDLYEKRQNADHTSSSEKPNVDSKVLSISKSSTNLIKKWFIRIKENFTSHKADYKYLLYAIPIIAIFLIAYEAKNIQKLFTGAALHNASVSFQLQNSTIPPAGTYGVWVNADAPVAFADIEITFDPSVIKLTSEVTPIGPMKIVHEQTTSMAQANSTGKIKIVLVSFDPTVDSSPPPAPTGAFQLANLTFDANTSSTNVSTNVNFDNSTMQIVSTDQSVFSLTSTALALTVNRANEASLWFSPSVPPNPQQVGKQFTTDLMASSGGQDISGVDAVVKYDATKLQITQVTPTTGNGFTSIPMNSYNNSTGVFKFSENIGSASSAPPVNGNNISLAKVTFMPIAAVSATEIIYDFTAGSRNDSNIVLKPTDSSQESTDILSAAGALQVIITAASTPTATPTLIPTPTATPTPTPTPTRTATPTAAATPTLTPTPIPTITATPTLTPTPTPSPQNMTLTFAFQGKSRAEASKATTITLSYKKANQTTTTNLNLTTNISGQTSVSLAPGSYVFLVKSPGYLARRFGTNALPINIQTNTTAINFSATPLLGGDFNGDGEVNEVDYVSYFLGNFGTANILTDLDGSGQVNNLDFGIMRGNWNLIDDIYQ